MTHLSALKTGALGEEGSLCTSLLDIKHSGDGICHHGCDEGGSWAGCKRAEPFLRAPRSAALSRTSPRPWALKLSACGTQVPREKQLLLLLPPPALCCSRESSEREEVGRVLHKGLPKLTAKEI